LAKQKTYKLTKTNLDFWQVKSEESGSGMHGIECKRLDLYTCIQAIGVESQIWQNGRLSLLYSKHGLIIYSHFKNK